LLSIVEFQSLPDWTKAVTNAIATLKISENEILDGESVLEERLSEEQRKRREFFLYYQQNEKNSDSSLIQANFGLPFLAIRKILKASFFFFPSNLN